MNKFLCTGVLIVFCSLYFPESYSQEKIISVPIKNEIISAYVDRVGELYIITSANDIQKFDINGKLLSVYKEGAAPTLFDPRDGSRLFAFFRKDRSVTHLSPSLVINNIVKIDSAFVLEPWLACSAGDHDLWILDAVDKTLKKLSLRTSTLPVEVNLPDDIKLSGVTFMREYQGFLFLLERGKGIHVFNSMGRWIKTISASDLKYFNFLGEELYYPEQGSLIFTNLFSGDQRKLPISEPFEIALVTDERIFLVKKTNVNFFQLKQ